MRLNRLNEIGEKKMRALKQPPLTILLAKMGLRVTDVGIYQTITKERFSRVTNERKKYTYFL